MSVIYTCDDMLQYTLTIIPLGKKKKAKFQNYNRIYFRKAVGDNSAFQKIIIYHLI